MKIDWLGPEGDRIWNAGILFLGGLVLAIVGIVKGFLPISTSLGVVSTLAGVGIWYRRPWGRVLGVLTAAGLCGYMLRVLFIGGFGWFTTLALVCTAWFGWDLWKEKYSSEDEDDDDDDPQPLTSFVLLLKEERTLDAFILASIVSRAWGGEYESNDTPGPNLEDQEGDRWVVGESPIFIARSPEGLFLIHNHGMPYFDETSEVASGLRELRVQKAVKDHRAWMSVDLLAPFDESRPTHSFYQPIGRLIAQLADEDCLAIYHPESQRLNPWDPELEENLKGPNPLAEFGTPVNPPVLQFDDDDPRLKAAADEAKRRFPEFAEAFQAKAGENFSVKAPVSRNDNREFIWIQVKRIGSEYIQGVLGNEPVNLGNLKIGSSVTVPVGDVCDWVFIRDDEPVGLFSRAAIEAAGEEMSQGE